MEIKVKYDELNIACNNIGKYNEELLQSIDELTKKVGIIGSIWQGDDGVIFCNETLNFINEMKQVPVAYSTLSNRIKNINESYREIDRHFANGENRIYSANYNKTNPSSKGGILSE